MNNIASKQSQLQSENTNNLPFSDTSEKQFEQAKELFTKPKNVPNTPFNVVGYLGGDKPEYWGFFGKYKMHPEPFETEKAAIAEMKKLTAQRVVDIINVLTQPLQELLNQKIKS